MVSYFTTVCLTIKSAQTFHGYHFHCQSSEKKERLRFHIIWSSKFGPLKLPDEYLFSIIFISTCIPVSTVVGIFPGSSIINKFGSLIQLTDI